MIATPTRTLRVFVVEDSDNVQSAFADLLATLGGASVVGTARTENEAIEWHLANTNDWDLAVVDLLLGDGSGFVVIQQLRKHRPAAQIVVFSDFVTPAVQHRCMELGADAVFNKSQSGGLADYLLARIERRQAGHA